MNTAQAAVELLAPYRDALGVVSDKARGRVTLAEALVRNEAAHVAEVRAAAVAPQGGWKNALPLEHATLTGSYIKSLRTGVTPGSLIAARTSEDAGLKRVAQTLWSGQTVFVDGIEWRGMLSDDLIEYAAGELYFYGE